jgi:predicted nuclease of predicted toxin-antitoxin system
MRLLFDQGTPVPLRSHLPDHLVATAYEKGWSALTNGELLSRAEAEGFDAIVTTDQNLRYQQNLTGRKISVIVYADDELAPDQESCCSSCAGN